MCSKCSLQNKKWSVAQAEACVTRFDFISSKSQPFRNAGWFIRLAVFCWLVLKGVMYWEMFIPCTSNGTSLWIIQITSLVGLGRMESKFSLRNRSCDFWSICQRLALFSATHQAALIISMGIPRDAQQQGKHRMGPRMCILWNTIPSYPLLGPFFSPKLCHWYSAQAIKFAKLRG